MRSAEPNELTTHAYPVLTAAVSEDELSRWFPVAFQHITDPQQTAEPAKAALIKLESGDPFVLYYGELSNQLMLRIPTSTDASVFVDALLREVPLPRGRIIWRRQDAQFHQPGDSDTTIIVAAHNDMFVRLFTALVNTVGSDEASRVFARVLAAANDALWDGVRFDESGRLDEQKLVANVTAWSAERRKGVLNDALTTLLSMALFEVAQHLDSAGKVDVFRFISDQKANLEKATA